ncbi:hypothetical protein CEXT_214231 [Caerostris extrusa]|uniref:Uncharacterized protein n=1 Tax=Caerostris extrusa TaxID=172846 RepID=A0AAV4XGC2_CAEEX|nr:hypothetical protein CEXT_214231 [Caerostris extrusa]
MYFSSNSHIMQRKLYLNLPNNPVLALNSVAFVMCCFSLPSELFPAYSYAEYCVTKMEKSNTWRKSNFPDPETTLGNSSEAEPVFVYFENNKDDSGIATVLINDENIPQVDSQNVSVPVE